MDTGSQQNTTLTKHNLENDTINTLRHKQNQNIKYN